MLKDHNAVTPVRLEPTAPQSRVKHCTNEPLLSLSSSSVLSGNRTQFGLAHEILVIVAYAQTPLNAHVIGPVKPIF